MTVRVYSAETPIELKCLTDDDLPSRLTALVRQEREDTAAVVEHLAEVDRRDLVQERGYASLFEYSVKKLGYSEPSAYHRIRAARAINKMPRLPTLLRAGELHLRTLVLLHPHLDDERVDELVQKVQGKSARETEAFLAPLSPRPQPRDAIRVVAVQPSPVDDMPLFNVSAPPSMPERAQLQALISFSANPVLLELLGEAKGLLWHKFPGGRLEDIFTEALRVLLEHKDPGRWATSTEGTRSAGRNIPKWIRRHVWRRDTGRCSYVAADGLRCSGRSGLEFDHVLPWARGGTSNDPANIRLLCRDHNQLEARRNGLERPQLSRPMTDKT